MEYLQAANIDLSSLSPSTQRNLVTLDIPTLYDSFGSTGLSSMDPSSFEDDSFMVTNNQDVSASTPVLRKPRKQLKPLKLLVGYDDLSQSVIDCHTNCNILCKKVTNTSFTFCPKSRLLSDEITSLKQQVKTLSTQNEVLLSLLTEKSKQFNRLLDAFEKPVKEVKACVEPEIKLNGDKNPKPIPAPRNLNKIKSQSTQETKSKRVTGSSSVTILSDSIPKRLNMAIDDVQVIIQPVAGNVNKATDFIQDYASPDTPLIVHTGTNNMDRESARTTQQRFQRLVSNIRHKQFKHVAISGIVYRGDNRTRNKVNEINTELRKICNSNAWMYIDNSNIHEGCLCEDNRHLNQEGLRILDANFTNCISNFMSTATKMIH